MQYSNILSYTNGLVSVIIPSYNHSEFIMSALDSVMKQDYPSIELIVIDDCSKDDSFQKIQAWAHDPGPKQRFDNIIIDVNTKNMGAHATLNRCMAMAHGEFISVLNSDDEYSANRISSLFATARYLNAQFLFTGVHVIDETGNRNIGHELAAEFESATDVAGMYPSISHAILKQNLALTTGNFFFSHALLKEIGNFRPLKYCHDWDFILRACLVAEPVLVSLPLYKYRVHRSNTYITLKKEKYLEPVLVVQYFFRQCLAGNCKNTKAPHLYTFPDWSYFIDMNSMCGAFHCLYEHCSKIKINSVLTLLNNEY